MSNSNTYMLNESSKTDVTILKNQTRSLNNSSFQHGIDTIDELRQGQNKRQNMFKVKGIMISQNQKHDDNEEDIEFEEYDDQEKTPTQKFPNRLEQGLSSFSNYEDKSPKISKIPSQFDINKADSELSPTKKSFNSQRTPKVKGDRLQLSPTKDMQKSFPTSSSDSSSDSDDSNDTPGGGNHSTQKKKIMNKKSTFQEQSIGGTKRQRDNDSMNFRKKRDKDASSRHFDHEASGIRNYDYKKKKTSVFGYDDQSQYAMSQQNNKQNYKRRMSSRRQANPKQIWQGKAFFIIMFVNKILFILKKALIFTRPHLLTTLQLNLINDKSSRDIGEGWGTRDDKIQKLIQKGFKKNEFMGGFAKTYKNIRKSFKKKFKRLIQLYVELQNNLKKLNNSIPVFDPMSKRIFVWELLIFLVTCFNFIIIPFDYSFSIVNDEISKLYFHKISPTIFLTDIVIRFNTCYFHRGYLVQERKKIIKNYLINQFIIDVITSFSLFTNYFSFKESYLVFLIRLFYFSKILDKLMESIMLNTKLSGIVSLLLLLAQVQFLCHIFTCAWHSLGNFLMNI